MKQGTTTTLNFHFNIDLNQVDSIDFFFHCDRDNKQKREPLLTKTYPTHGYEQDGVIYIPLKQEETAVLPNKFYIEPQINFIDKSSTKAHTKAYNMEPTIYTHYLNENQSSGEEENIDIEFEVDEAIVIKGYDYEESYHKPKINDNELIGNKTGTELGLQDKLIAGENISINNNIISALNTAPNYAAGSGIEILDDEISISLINDGGLVFVNEQLAINSPELGAHIGLRQSLANTNINYALATKSEVDTKADQANTYTKTEVDEKDTSVLNSAKTDAENKATAALNASKEYTDNIKVTLANGLNVTINPTTYVCTFELKNGNTIIDTASIDLPLESVVVSGRYDSTTKEVVLTLQNGSEIRFSVADLVSGLINVGTFESAISNLQNQISAKADAANVYTKTEINNTVTNIQNDITNVRNQATCAIALANDAGVEAESAYNLATCAEALGHSVETVARNAHNAANDAQNSADNALSVANVKADKTVINTDRSSTTGIVTLEDNHEYRFTQNLNTLVITIPEGDFIAGVVFSSGTTSTQVVCDSDVKWSGDGVVDGVFTPDPETVYNLVFWYDGININAVSRGA